MYKIDVQMSFVIRRTLLIALKVFVRYKNCLIFELHNLQQGPNYHDNVFDCLQGATISNHLRKVTELSL